MIREIEINRKLASCQNITKFYGFTLHERELLICMELMTMSLKQFYTYVHQDYNFFPENLLIHVCISILDALRYCKLFSFVHRDVKPANILLNRAGEVKLCDFGLARKLDNSLFSTIAGTYVYMAPEYIMNRRGQYDIRSDIWSFGITMAETALGRLPYDIDKKTVSPPHVHKGGKILPGGLASRKGKKGGLAPERENCKRVRGRAERDL